MLGRNLGRIYVSIPCSPRWYLVLSSLFYSNTILQAEMASHEDVDGLPHQPQDLPNFTEIKNHPTYCFV